MEHMMQKVKQLLDYADTHLDVILTYHTSDMVLADHSDALYLSEKISRSRAGGNVFISNNTALPPNNGSVLTKAKIIKAVMSSVEEAELGELFIKCK